MTDNPISFKFIKEDESTLQYHYEGELTIDFSQAGIFQINKSIFNKIDDMDQIDDCTLYAMNLLLDGKMSVVKLCQNPMLSENNEDYCAIIACAKIISGYMEKHQTVKEGFVISEKLYSKMMENKEFLDLMKEYDLTK